MIQRFLDGFASLFESSEPRAAAALRHTLLLVLIVALGGALRLWELGAVGLHGDEETMAMPTMHIVEHGEPLLPSGMYYPRALAQLYLMAASVSAFGESEWALRLPSALCGTLLIVLAYVAGRRFLTARWNLAFAAAIAFLPAFVVDAQTARMYTFLVASVAAVMILVFAWERSGRLAFLLGAVAMLVFALQFQSLAVFSTFLFLFPGLLHGDRRKLLWGLIAFAVGVAAFGIIEAWVLSHYPSEPPVEGVVPQEGARARWAVPDGAAPAWLGAAAIAAGLAIMVVRRIQARGAAWAAGLLIAGGVFAQLVFYYHAAALLLVAGAVVALMHDRSVGKRVLILAAISAVIAGAHIAFLRYGGVESFKQTFGAMIGRPSIWPLLVVTGYSLGASLAIGAALVVSLVLIARRVRIPDFMLLFVLGVWLPLMLMGAIQWFVPLRYTEGQAFPLLLVGMAAAQWLWQRWRAGSGARESHAPVAHAAVAALAAVALVDPVTLARTVGAGYAMHPDHKGAAEFIGTQHLAPADLVLAEDVLQQTYYLGKVDFWLIGRDRAAQFLQAGGTPLRDIYTGTPLIGTASELEALIARPDRGTIYIIGSGENQEDGRRIMRSHGLAELLESGGFDVVYDGRDGHTKVWRIPPRGADAIRHAAAR